MRLFLIGWGNFEPELKEIFLELKKRSHEIVYWVRSSETAELDKSQFPTTIFHDYNNARQGKPAPGVDTSNFLPPGEDLIKQLYEAESIILTMMNKGQSRLSTVERKHLYYHLIEYWLGVIKAYKPEVIIISATPHAAFEFVIYALAKLLKIRTIILDYAWVSDRALLYDDYIEGDIKLATEILDNRHDFSLQEISSDIQEYYNKQINPKIDSTPLCTKIGLASFAGINLFFKKWEAFIDSVKNLTIFNRLIEFLIKQFKPNLKKEYLAAMEKNPDFEKKFIYVPLQYQPECTTSPMGGIFVDQILMIENLAAAIPDDWLIYVKEHPGQWLPMGLNFTDFRYKDYYRHLAEIKNVRLIPIETNSYLLIEKAQAIATVTGTAGWEAILRDKSCLIFGYSWYRNAPGVFKVTNVASCQLVIEKITKGFKIEKQQIINYLAMLDKFSFHAYYDMWSKKTSKLSPQENRNNFLKALIAKIENRQ